MPFGRALRLACLGLFVTQFGFVQQAPAHGEPLATFIAHLELQVPVWLDRHEVPGVALGLVHEGEVVWTGAFGYADRGQHRELTTADLFRVESISKSVSALGAMMLMKRGLIDLEDQVQLHLGPERTQVSGAVGPEVTVAHLLSNSAGLPLGPIGEEYAPGSAMPSLVEFLEREVRVVSQPGTRFMYSNVGYALLELMVEEVTGRDFAAYMRDEVLVPLGMRSSTFAWDDALAASLPTGYDLDGAPVRPYRYPVKAAGELLAPVDDVARFVAAAVKAPAAAPGSELQDALHELHAPRVPIAGIYGFVADSYAAGHFTETLRDGRLAVWHGGQGHGWMSHFHAIPGAGEGIVILTNSQRSWPLIAEVLDDWALWSGLGPLGMSVITRATAALRVTVGLSLLLTLWLLLRLVLGLRRGTRRWGPLSGDHRSRRLVQVAIGASALLALATAAAQPYLFVSSIFPGLWDQASLTFAALGLVLVASALFKVVPATLLTK